MPMGVIITNELNPKIKTPEARDLCKTCDFFLLKYHPLHQVNVIAHLSCHVTYVTAFNKCSDLDVKLAKSIMIYYMSKTIPNMQDFKQQQIFSYIFTSIIHTKLGSFKLGVGLSNCSYKTLYL